MKPNPVIQQFIEETRELTTRINEFSEHWHDIEARSPPVDQIPEKQKRQLIKAVSMFELACEHIMEKR